MRIAIAAVLAVCCFAMPARAGLPVNFMMKLTVDGQQIEGTPLAWNKQLVRMLGRDGRLWEFSPGKATNYVKSSSRFRSYSPSELRATLLRELGKGFEVTGTSHYLVAHPSGERDKWAQRFEDLYRSFVHYFSARGFRPVEPPFPLIGVVCRNQREFQQYAARQGSPVGSGVLGLYSPTTNRIILYNVGGRDASQAWQTTATTIIHEATHQTAFNTGMHSRYAQPPAWVGEGLATMFEMPGVYDSRHYTRRQDRINYEQLEAFRRFVAPRHKPELLSTMVASDRIFGGNTTVAYAEAWALTFYLSETQPRKYTKYLAITAGRPHFTDYPPAERRADFTSLFGDDWEMLEARLLRFIAGLK